MPSLGTRRNQVNADGTTIYENVLEMLQKSESTNLGSHEFGETFDRKFDSSGHYGSFYLTKNNLKFTANIVAEIGSQEEGTWLAAYPKNWPADKLPLTDSSGAYRMVIAARCPTDTIKEIEEYFGDGLATADGVRSVDHKQEVADHQKFFVTEWVTRPDKQRHLPGNILVLHLPSTYEVAPSSNAQRTSPTNGGTECPRNTKSRRAAEAQSPTQSEDAEMGASVAPITENRKIGDLYDPNLFPEHRGDWFRHSSNVKIVQRDIRDEDDKLIAPFELREKLTEGTLFCATLSLKTYVWPESKTYHMYIERLKILDQGSGDPWSYPIPTSTPSKKRTRNLESAVDADVDDDFKAFQSPSKKSRA
ncbi:hypothetical protein K438DRAFT_1982692 [Mycena galopus ATCC 62051]|nr:hypothetical protein K438DRAFT_1982692 [Mycena galopus ATCC 62051]